MFPVMCVFAARPPRLLGKSLKSQQGFALRLITSFSTEHTHTLSKTSSRGSPIKLGTSLLYGGVWMPEGASNIPETAAMFQLVSVGKASTWHGQRTPGDRRKNGRFHSSPSVLVCFCLHLCLSTERLGKTNELAFQDYRGGGGVYHI